MLIFIIFLSIENSKGILQFKKIIDNYNFKDYKIIINLNINNYDIKKDLNFDFNLINIQDELVALLFSIHYFDIKETDFIVKLNGDCLLMSHSPFMREVFKLNEGITDYDVISKYYFTDLIGMRCKYITKIDKNSDFNMNMKWELVKNLIDNKKQLNLEYLGIDISKHRHNSIFTTY